MKETGIVRRIDELGRVVIPKEIRKTLRINEGDPLEIYTERDQLLLKKYSPIGAIIGYAKGIAESLYEQTSRSVVIVDTDMVLAVKGHGTKEYEQNPISEELLKLLRQRKTLLSQNSDNKKIKITNRDNLEFSSQLIMPIITAGDLVGGVVIISKEAEIDANTISLTAFSVDFLSRQA